MIWQQRALVGIHYTQQSQYFGPSHSSAGRIKPFRPIKRSGSRPLINENEWSWEWRVQVEERPTYWIWGTRYLARVPLKKENVYSNSSHNIEWGICEKILSKIARKTRDKKYQTPASTDCPHKKVRRFGYHGGYGVSNVRGVGLQMSRARGFTSRRRGLRKEGVASCLRGVLSRYEGVASRLRGVISRLSGKASRQGGVAYVKEAWLHVKEAWLNVRRRLFTSKRRGFTSRRRVFT